MYKGSPIHNLQFSSKYFYITFFYIVPAYTATNPPILQMMNYSKILTWYLDKYDMKAPWSQWQEDYCFCHKNGYFWFCCSSSMSLRHAGVAWTFVIWLVLYLYRTRILIYIWRVLYLMVVTDHGSLEWGKHMKCDHLPLHNHLALQQ